MNTLYIYSLFYIYLNFKLIHKDNDDNNKKIYNEKKIISFNKYFKLNRLFYKNQLINSQKAINIFKYIIYQIKSSNNEIQLSFKMNTI